MRIISTIFAVLVYSQVSAQSAVNFPVTFDNTTLNYALVDFGGDSSLIAPDPTGGTNLVCKVIKKADAAGWAGTTVGSNAGFATRINLSATASTISMRVYSPDAGIPVRMKIEVPGVPTQSVETDVRTTRSGAWETLVFDFRNQAPGTAPVNYTYNYAMLSVFFNFNVTGATAGAKTYYFDDIEFGGTPAVPPVFTFNVQNPVGSPVYLFGDWNGWGNWPGLLMNSIGNDTYQATVTLAAGSTIEYLFVTGATPVKEGVLPSMPCTNGNAQFTNRVSVLGSRDSTLCAVWANCQQCSSIGIEELGDSGFKVVVSKDGVMAMSEDLTSFESMEVYDVLGRCVYASTSVQGFNNMVHMELQSHTVYLVRIGASGRSYTYKAVVGE